MANLVITNSNFTQGSTIVASQFNTNFSDISSYINARNAGTTAWDGVLAPAATFTSATNQLILGTTNTTTISATAPASSATYTIPDVGTSANFILSAGTQTIGGTKTFSAGVIKLTATNNAILTAATMAADRTLTIPDPGTDASFVMTAGSQTIAGTKTFSSAILAPASGVAYSFTGDTTTGLKRVGAGDLKLVSGGNDVIEFIDGVIRPFTKVEVDNSSAGTAVNPDFGWRSGNCGMFSDAANVLKLSTNSTTRLTISSAGVVTIAGKANLDGSTGNPIHGTNTNDSAAAGYVGEVISNTGTSSTFPASGVYADLTSIDLTAGDWMINGLCVIVATTGSVISPNIGISSSSGNSSTGLTNGSTVGRGASSADSTVTIPPFRVSVASTTTYYLKYEAATVTNNVSANGRITAVRIR